LRFTEIICVLPVETTGTRVLNTLLLLLVALEPYLLNTLLAFFVNPQPPGPFAGVASTIYALDIGAIYAILALFTNILATEEKRLGQRLIY